METKPGFFTGRRDVAPVQAEEPQNPEQDALNMYSQALAEGNATAMMDALRQLEYLGVETYELQKGSGVFLDYRDERLDPNHQGPRRGVREDEQLEKSRREYRDERLPPLPPASGNEPRNSDRTFPPMIPQAEGHGPPPFVEVDPWAPQGLLREVRENERLENEWLEKFRRESGGWQPPLGETPPFVEVDPWAPQSTKPENMPDPWTRDHRATKGPDQLVDEDSHEKELLRKRQNPYQSL